MAKFKIREKKTRVIEPQDLSRQSNRLFPTQNLESKIADKEKAEGVDELDELEGEPEENSDNQDDPKEKSAEQNDTQDDQRDQQYTNIDDTTEESNLNNFRKEVDPRSSSANSENQQEENLEFDKIAPSELTDNFLKEDFKSNSSSIESIKDKVTIASKLTSSILGLLVNPVFWAIMGLILVGAFFSSAMLIIGQNDYNKMCDSDGVGGILIDSDADDFTRQSAIVSWLTSTPFKINNGQPLTQEQAIGIMGNLIQESYGGNPKAIQNDHSISQWETCGNQCVLSWGNVGGKAIGIIQWDRGRRQELVNFAISEGKEWYDLSVQLKYLKNEMDNGYEYQQLIKGGFNDKNKTVADYVRIWNQYFERSSEAFGNGNNIRITYAEEFASKYAGGGGGLIGGLSNNCIGGLTGVDTSNLIQLAIASSWPTKDEARGVCRNPGSVNCGQTYATAEYKEIKLLAEQMSTKDPIPGLLASCDRYVATMYRASGKDINFPWGNANSQGAYMKSSPKWRAVSCQDRQPGDVLWRSGHVMLYLGNVNGQDSIGSASYTDRTGSISGAGCSGDMFVGDGDTAYGFRLVG